MIINCQIMKVFISMYNILIYISHQIGKQIYMTVPSQIIIIAIDIINLC